MIGTPIASIHDEYMLEWRFDNFLDNSTREQGVLERSLGPKCTLDEVTTPCMYGY